MVIVEKIFEKKYQRVDLQIVEDGVAVLTSKDRYIPIEEFKNVFQDISEMITSYGIKKLVFDKRSLRVFHQPSMEWYYSEWKEKTYDLGLRIHRKILPNDSIFMKSVELGMRSISKKYPNAKYKLMDIKYFDSVEEAIAN